VRGIAARQPAVDVHDRGRRVVCAVGRLRLHPLPVLLTLAHAADALHSLLFLLFLAACVIDPEGLRPLTHLLKRPSWLMRFVLVSVLPWGWPMLRCPGSCRPALRR
jgi:hypothetical protein